MPCLIVILLNDVFSGVKNLFQTILLLSTAMFVACAAPKKQSELQEGDILFQDLDCGALCDAIEAVTEGVDGMDFSHCAMVVKINDTLKVVEAIGNSVQINSITDFYNRSGNNSETVVVGRVKPSHRQLIEKAAAFSLEQLGSEYDDAFHLNNGKWYCSELIFESFRQADGGQDFFELRPMTFKDPNTGEFFPAWIEYYSELGVEIPEGEAGLNPGSISRSDKIEIIQINFIR